MHRKDKFCILCGSNIAHLQRSYQTLTSELIKDITSVFGSLERRPDHRICQKCHRRLIRILDGRNIENSMKNDLNRTPTKSNSDGDDVKDVVDGKEGNTNIDDSIVTDKNLNTSTCKKATDTTEEKLTSKTQEDPKDAVTDVEYVEAAEKNLRSGVAEQDIDDGRLVVVVRCMVVVF